MNSQQEKNDENPFRSDRAGLQSKSGGIYDSILADSEGVTKRLEALINEQRKATLGYGATETPSLDGAADLAREVVVGEIDRYVAENEITESERQWAEMAADTESM